MPKIINNIVNAVFNFFSSLATPIRNATSSRGWVWTVKDPQGDSKSEINEAFKNYMQHEGIRAGQFALHVNGTLKIATAYTWAEPDYMITETDSLMRVASCSKTFTQAAILDLIQVQHSLTGDEHVFEFLGITMNDPSVSADPSPADPKVRDIMVRHLFTHSGGWNVDSHPTHDWVFRLKEIGSRMGLHRPPTKQDFAKWMFNRALDFPPGTESHYSNIGYLLLGMVVEKASGLPTYIDYLNQHLLSPLGISDVFVGATRLSGRRANEVEYHDPGIGPDATTDPSDNSLVPFPYGGDGAMTEVMDSGGGLITTATSLSKFIVNYNVLPSDIVDGNNQPTNRGRNGAAWLAKDGNMPGTSAIACSFLGDDGKTQFDMAFIFNQQDFGISTGKQDFGHITLPPISDKFNRFTGSMTDLIKLANWP